MAPERSTSMSCLTALPFPRLDTLSSDLADDSLRAQLSLVNRRLDEFQREFHRSRDEAAESHSGGSPFTQEIQDKLVPLNFHLLTLEMYDGESDLAEHVVAFQVQMALYDTSDALMYRAFPTTLRGPAQTWFNRLQPTSVSSFD